jgi:hypothetical protein
MTKIVATIAVLMFAFAAAASAQVSQNYSSPDARPAAATQDFRSPDAKAGTAAPATQDLRSPDARPSAQFQPSLPTAEAQSSDSFQWGYLAVAIAAALVCLTGLVIVQRRRHHGLAIGS